MYAQLLEHDVISRSEIGPVWDRISLFGGLNDQQINTLLPRLNKITAAAGKEIFAQGQLPCNIYIVIDGRINMDIEREDGTRCEVEYLPGDCFGETAGLGSQPHLGRAVAATSANLLVISRSSLMELVQQDNELFALLVFNIAREVSRRLHAIATSPRTCQDYTILRA